MTEQLPEEDGPAGFYEPPEGQDPEGLDGDEVPDEDEDDDGDEDGDGSP